jgi:dihydrofolate reductase
MQRIARSVPTAAARSSCSRQRPKEAAVSRVIVIQFVTLDGVVHDPDGADGSPGGDWAFRHGPAAVAGDKFHLGELMETGALLLGRRTWEKFADLWPARDDPFSTRMNQMRKLVVTRTVGDVSGWSNSYLAGDLEAAVAGRDRDLVVAGSLSVARALMRQRLIDEHRLLVFPTALGRGERLFEEPAELRLTDSEPAGPAMLLTYVPG